VTVRYHGDAKDGLGGMLGELVEQNLLRDPRRHRLLHRAAVVVRARDAGVSVTLRLKPGDVLVDPGEDPSAAVRITADGRDLLDVAAAPLRIGLPDPLRPAGRAALGMILTGRVRIRGLVRHLPTVRRLTMLLSAT
jgi:hypothetical protein